MVIYVHRRDEAETISTVIQSAGGASITMQSVISNLYQAFAPRLTMQECPQPSAHTFSNNFSGKVFIFL